MKRETEREYTGSNIPGLRRRREKEGGGGWWMSGACHQHLSVSFGSSLAVGSFSPGPMLTISNTLLTDSSTAKTHYPPGPRLHQSNMN